MNHRLPRQARGDEDASTLKFGAEFQEASCLSISEVNALLEQRDLERASITPVYEKAASYVKQFANFQDVATITSVRAALQKMPDLAPFEQAQLSNLVPETVEEAKSLIPSLRKKPSEELEPLLSEIQTLRRYQ